MAGSPPLDGDDDLLANLWQQRADTHERDAIKYAQLAAHHARLSQLQEPDDLPRCTEAERARRGLA